MNSSSMSSYIRAFLEIGLSDVGLVGGKTASRGELYTPLVSQGIDCRQPKGAPSGR
jgi:hypothetical protein